MNNLPDIDVNIFSDSDDSIEDIEDFENILYRRPYTIRRRPDHMNFWDDEDFKIRFRLSKNTVNLLVNQIQHLLLYTTNR